MHILTLPQSEMVFITVAANSDIWLFTLEESSVCVVRSGCFEAYVSEKVLSSELDMTLDNFFELAAQGNKNNSDVLDEYMDNLALGINNIYTMMDCDIVLGGTVAPYLKQYENSIKERLVNDYSFDTDADYLRISDGGGRKSGLGAALSFVARFIDGVE